MKNFLKILLLAVILSTPLFAVDEIFTWGYGRQMHDLLRAVAALTGSTNDSLIKTAVGIGMLVLTLRLAANGQNAFMDITKFIGMTIFVTQLFWTQKGDFIVKDQTNNFLSPAVLQLPYGVGMTFSLFSKLENGVGQAFETNFSTPNSISYQKAGLGFMMSAHLGMDSLTTSDPSLVKTFNEYLDNCLLNSAAMGNLDISNLKNSTDLINALEVNEAWLTPVYTGTAAGVMMDCKGAWGNIKARIPGDASNGVSVFAKSFGQLSAGDVTSKLGDVAQTMFGNAAISSSSYINQMSLMNMYSEGMQAVALSTASDLSAVATASAIAQSSTKAGWIQAGLQAKRTLPMQKAFLTMMSVVMLMLMSLYAIAIVDFSGIKQMFQLLFVYTLWTPLTIVINYLMYSTIESVASGMTGNNLPTLLSKAAISNETQSYLAFLGYAVALVTGMAFALVTKNASSFVQGVMSSGMSASTMKAAEMAGGLGSFNHGNVGIQNTSVGNTSKFGMSYYGNEIAGQSEGQSISVKDGNFHYANSNKGTSTREWGSGVASATFEGDKMTSLSTRGLDSSVTQQIANVAASERMKTESFKDAKMIQSLDALMTSYSKADSASQKKAIAESSGYSVEHMESMAKTYSEAKKTAHEKVIGNKEAHKESDSLEAGVTAHASAKVGTPGAIGAVTGVQAEAGVTGTVANKTSTSKEKTSEKSSANKTSQEQQEAINKQVADTLKSNKQFMSTYESALTHTDTLTKNKSHSDSASKLLEYAELKQKSEKLAEQETKASSLSQNINLLAMERLAEKHNAHTADQKLEWVGNFTNDIVAYGNKEKRAEYENEVNAILAEHGLNPQLAKQVGENLKNVDTSIQAGAIQVNSSGGAIESRVSNMPSTFGAPQGNDDYINGMKYEFSAATWGNKSEMELMGVERGNQFGGTEKNYDQFSGKINNSFSGFIAGPSGLKNGIENGFTAELTPEQRSQMMSKEAKRGLFKDKDKNKEF